MGNAGFGGESMRVIATAEWSIGEGTPVWVLDWSKVSVEAAPAAFKREASLGYKTSLRPEELIALARKLATSVLDERRGAVTKLRARCDEARTIYHHFKAIHDDQPLTAELVEFWESLKSGRKVDLPDEADFTAADLRVLDVKHIAEEVRDAFARDEVKTAEDAQRELEKIRWRIEEAQWALEGRPDPSLVKGVLPAMNDYMRAMVGVGHGGEDIIKALDYTKTGCWAVFTVVGAAIFGTGLAAGFAVGAVGGLLDAAANELGTDVDFTNWDGDTGVRVVWSTLMSGVTNMGGGWVVQKVGMALVAPMATKIVSKVGLETLGFATVEIAEARVKDVIKDSFGNALGGIVTDFVNAGRVGQWPDLLDLIMHIIANLVFGGLAGSLNTKLDATSKARLERELREQFPPSEWLSAAKVRWYSASDRAISP